MIKKPILVILMMLFSFVSFANDYVKKENKSETIILGSKEGKKTYEKNNMDDGWYATCSVTISNSETGETREIKSFGYGATPSSAQSNCASNVMKIAQAIVDDLNNQQD